MPHPQGRIPDPVARLAVRSRYRTLGSAGGDHLIGAGVLDKSGDVVDAANHTSPFWSCVVVLRGRASYRDSLGIARELGPGSLLHRFTDRRHDMRIDPGSRYREVFLVPGRAVLDVLLALELVDPLQPVVRVSPDQPWLAWADRLIDQLPDADEAELAPLALDMGSRIGALLAAGGQERDPAQGFRAVACRELLRDITAREPLAAVAGRLGLGAQAFARRFRAVVGQSPGQYRIRRRIDRARDLLASGGRTVAEVAALLGYPSPFAFSRQFTAVAGSPPSLWRH
jgi:AraC family transcriptional regulator of arabinose operon